MRKEDRASNSQVFPFHPSFLRETTFARFKTKLSTHFHLPSELKACFLQNSKLFIHRTPMRSTNRLWIAFTHFHPKVMREISYSIETCLFMILHETFNLWIHVPNLSFLVKISLLHMKLVVWPACQVCQFWHHLNSDLHEKR